MRLAVGLLVLLAPCVVNGVGFAQASADLLVPALECEQQWTKEERAVIEILRGLRKKERLSDLELAARLSLPGECVLALFFEVLATRTVPALEAERPQVLSEIQEKALLLAVAQFERDSVLAHVGTALLASDELPRRQAALACIGAVARANDLPQLFELALDGGEKEPDKRLAKALGRAVTSMLARDPRGIEQLVSLRRITRPELLLTLVEAVGATRDPQGLAYLSEIAYWHEGLVLAVMSQVSLLGPSGDEAIDGAMRVRLRTHLDEEDPGPCRAAITALVALRDMDAISALIPLLDSESSALRENAHWALKKLTGLSMGPSPETWARWHQAELYWLARQKPKEFQRLRENDPAVATDALRGILTHPLARQELASALPDLLRSRWPALRLLACSSLAELGAHEAVGRLVWTLEDRDPDVAKAAHSALQRLSHLDLPPDPVAWQEATNTQPQGTEL